MEKKKKVLCILARVLAIVTALVCTLCMVVPSYAEETEMETARGQEAKLNAMVGSDVFRASDHVVDLNYRNYGTYVTLASQNVNINWPTQTYQYALVALGQTGYVYISYTDANGVAGEYGQLVHQVQLNESLSSTIIILEDTVSEKKFMIKYERAQSDGYRISKPTSVYNYDRTLNLEYSSGASWQGYCILNTAKEDIFYCVSEGLYNPMQMLGFNMGTNNDEIYDQGYQAGYNEGLEEGIDRGEVTGYNEGYNTGLWEGHQNGYNEGYDDGMTQMPLIDLVKEIIRSPIELIENSLNFDIFGINLAGAAKAVITCMMIALVVVFVWKAVK